MSKPANAASGTTVTANSHCGGTSWSLQSSSHDPLLAAFTSRRAALASDANAWFAFLVVATVFVAVGVILEFSDDVAEVYEAVRARKPVKKRKIVVFIGTLLVAVGVSAEIIAEGKSGHFEARLEDCNAAIQGVLEKRDREATQAAVAMADKFGGLKDFVDAKSREANVQRDRFARLAEDDEAKNAAVLADLIANRVRLETARTDAVAAAGAAKSNVGQMEAALQEERSLNARFATMATPRVIDDVHLAQLISAISPFPKTPIELALTRDNEAGDLLLRVYDALKASSWDVEPWSGSGITLFADARPDMPALGDLTTRNVQVQINDADKDKLGPAALALANSLVSNGFVVSFTVAPAPAKGADGKPVPPKTQAVQPVAPGRIRLVVGARG